MAQKLSMAGLATVVENTSRLLHASGHAEGLYPAQWVALRYFAEVSEAQRTASALARYQDLAIASVARTVVTLVDKGLLTKRPNPRDARADLLELTEKGRELLKSDPRLALERALAEIADQDIEAYARTATKLLQRLLELRQGRADS
ncbi:MarR family winged helix-turn-helix transcriptional regulator [Azospirillum brasilense]|uniref:MarR family winged helix-turn-helix transcriptional regulator n=1 Tax=Azospirillum brasilense TaxID=192 RepID=UPI000E682AD7|nr:MarR family transcriptional regulator [Azospirillum brasilense]NUB24750.1 MarR family transcriptional regulator [Azospirillum brasilense]NUB32711.1 MarR family transcriptional regulator [Azospirillum brasilense]RIW08149.1 MarR family transcriptional regulator [Azospirillum brasilense]